MSQSQPNASKRRFLFHRPEIRFFRRTCIFPTCVAAMMVLVTSGCGHIMIRQDGCSSAPLRIMDEVVEPELDASCATGSVRDRLEIIKAKLEFQGERFQGGIGRCSGKLSECWYRSHLAQWAEKHREQANAPPPPKFHPIPTHAAFFPENDEASLTSGNQETSQEILSVIE